MNVISIKVNRIWMLVLYLVLAIVFLFSWNLVPNEYSKNYAVLYLAYIIVGGLFFGIESSGKVKLFDTFTIVSILYLMIMVVYPIYDYTRLNLLKGGVDTSDGCIKATLIFILSYIFFCIGYFSTTIRINKDSKFFSKIEKINDKEMAMIGLFCWIIAFIGCMIGQMSRGFSLDYILSLGRAAQDDIMVTSSSGGLLFLLMLSPTVIVSELMICIYGKNKIIKVFVVLLTAIYLFMRGSRVLFFVFIASPIIYWYLRRGKSPSFKTVLLGCIFFLFIFTVMMAARTSISRGIDFRESVVSSIFSIDTYMSVFESDFSTYKVFYGIVNAIPSKMNYLFGKGIFGYTLALVIPRIIWPGKPDAPEHEIVRVAVGEVAANSGNAYPNIGTFYSEFGILGCIIFMFVFGKLMSKSRKLYKLNAKSALLLYSCLWPFCFQLTARSISNAVYSIFFGFLPILVAWFYSIIKRRR